MVSSAAIQGIAKYGHGWRASIKIAGISEHIDTIFNNAESNEQVLKIAHDKACMTARYLIKAYLSKIPEDSKDELGKIIECLFDVFILGASNEDNLAVYDRDFAKLNLRAIQNQGNEEIKRLAKESDSEDIEELVDGLADEMIGQLGELYDWADYYRICIH